MGLRRRCLGPGAPYRSAQSPRSGRRARRSTRREARSAPTRIVAGSSPSARAEAPPGGPGEVLWRRLAPNQLSSSRKPRLSARAEAALCCLRRELKSFASFAPRPKQLPIKPRRPTQAERLPICGRRLHRVRGEGSFRGEDDPDTNFRAEMLAHRSVAAAFKGRVRLHR